VASHARWRTPTHKTLVQSDGYGPKTLCGPYKGLVGPNHLHNGVYEMADRLPLTEVSGDEVLARVTYQIILADYRLTPDLYETPAERILQLADEWFKFGATDLAQDLRLAGIWCAHGSTLASWLQSRVLIASPRISTLMRAGRSRRR
jgi:hypothetical protein